MPTTSYRYLTNIPGVCAGRTIVEGTRIGVHDVVGLIVNGASVDDVCRAASSSVAAGRTFSRSQRPEESYPGLIRSAP